MNLFKQLFPKSSASPDLTFHFSNLVKVIHADKKVLETETELLYKLADKYGFPRSTVKKMLKDGANPDDAGGSWPEEEGERFERFYDYVQMMLVDGDRDKSELICCRIFGEALGYKKIVIDDLIRAVTINILAGNDAATTHTRVAYLLNN